MGRQKYISSNVSGTFTSSSHTKYGEASYRAFMKESNGGVSKKLVYDTSS
mgnify:CR=1 FL=1